MVNRKQLAICSRLKLCQMLSWEMENLQFVKYSLKLAAKTDSVIFTTSCSIKRARMSGTSMIIEGIIWYIHAIYL